MISVTSAPPGFAVSAGWTGVSGGSGGKRDEEEC